MEAMMKPYKWENFPGNQKIGFKLFRTRIGWLMISVMNVFITQLLPKMIIRKLSSEEKDYYRAPFKTVKSRKPVRQWPLEIPIDGQPSDVHDAISNYSQKLRESDLPKLLFFAVPGVAIETKMLDWCKQNLKNLKVVDIGEGLHFIQEDNPHMIGEELATWYNDI